jgi:hypothetical protein
VTTPDEARNQAGPPPILWAPSLVIPGTLPPFYTGHAIWHRHHEVWCRMAAYEAYGNHPPDDAILLTPDNPADGSPDLAAKVEHLEQMIQQALGQNGR